MTKTTEITSTDVADNVSCALCDYTHGQIWLPDVQNCHMYYVCQPLSGMRYAAYHMTCGVLYWKQEWHTCVRARPANCKVAHIVTYKQSPTKTAPCPYEPVPGNGQRFRKQDDHKQVQMCVEGMVFRQHPECTCIPDAHIAPSCNDSLLLHFPFEKNFDDITCHGAVAMEYGPGNVKIVNDPVHGNVASFDGRGYLEVPFMRTWFANYFVSTFSISLWFRHSAAPVSTSGVLINNGNCKENASFELWSEDGDKINAGIRTSMEQTIAPVKVVSDVWYHTAWVYNGRTLKFYLDGILMDSEPVSGYMASPDVPLHIGFKCGRNDLYFTGQLDELRLYDRVLTEMQVAELSKEFNK